MVFLIVIKGLDGKLFTIDVESNDTIRNIKAKIEKETKIPIKQQRLIFASRMLEDDKILRYHYNIPPDSTIDLKLGLRGGDCPGPNVNNKVIQKEWSKKAPAWRTHTRGLNIEFQHKGKNVIGQIGYTTDKSKFPKGVFEAHKGKHIRLAYCPSENVYCANHDSIVKYWFNSCKVVFEGELTSGTEINKTEVFPNQACKYEGEPAKYANLEMTVTPN